MSILYVILVIGNKGKKKKATYQFLGGGAILQSVLLYFLFLLQLFFFWQTNHYLALELWGIKWNLDNAVTSDFLFYLFSDSCEWEKEEKKKRKKEKNFWICWVIDFILF